SVETDERTLGALKRDAETGGNASVDLIKQLQENIAETKKSAEEFKKRWMRERDQAHKVVAARNKLNELLNPKKQEPGAQATGKAADKASEPKSKEAKSQTKDEAEPKDDKPKFDFPDNADDVNKTHEKE